MSVFKGKGCFMAAEVSANHGQSLDRALLMIKKARECGADAVKFQTYTPDTITIDADNRYFRIRHSKWAGQTLYELYKKASTPWGWFKRLKKAADEEGIKFFSTAFDKSSVDLLEEIGVPFHKIASFELVDLPLIEYAARTKKPLILSTGMATKKEIKDAVNTARGAGAREVVLLKCVSSYPAQPKDMNLSVLPGMKSSFGCPVGISDHTLGSGVAVAAAVLGAEMIEKHFTLSRKIKTPDSFFSSEPQELRELVKSVREAESALLKSERGLTPEEKKNRAFRRSLFAVEDIKKGELFSEDNVRSIRPAYGLPPGELKNILGRKASRDIKRGTPLSRSLIVKTGGIDR